MSSHVAVGRPAGEQRRGEHHAEHVTALDLGRQEAETVERVGHVLPPEAQRQHPDGRIADARERLEPVAAGKVEVDLVETVGRRGVDHGIVQLGGLKRGADRPPLGSRAEAG